METVHSARMDKREKKGRVGWMKKKADTRGKRRTFIILKVFCNVLSYTFKRILFTAAKRFRNES